MTNTNPIIIEHCKPAIGSMHVYLIDQSDHSIISVNRTTCTIKPIPKTSQFASHLSNILCSNCHHSLLVSPSKMVETKPLPSHGWMELVECWSCHENEFASIAEKPLVAQQDPHQLLPAIGSSILFYQNSHMVVPLDLLLLDPSNQSCCTNCHQSIVHLSYTAQRNQNLSPSDQSHFTHASLIPNSVIFKDSNNLIVPYNSSHHLLTLLVQELLDYQEAHGLSIFQLSNQSTEISFTICNASSLVRINEGDWKNACTMLIADHVDPTIGFRPNWHPSVILLFLQSWNDGLLLAKQLALNSCSLLLY